MIALTKAVQRYYEERTAKKSSLFGATAKYRICIHDIVNLNGTDHGWKVGKFFMDRSNDLVLLRMIRKKSELSRYLYEFQLDEKHRRRYFNFKKWSKKIGS